MRLWSRYQAWRSWRTWRQLMDQLPAPDRPAANPYDFHLGDGVDYRQPAIVPSSVAALGMEATRQYLQETDQTYRNQFDTNRSGTYDGPVIGPTDDPLCEWNWATRKAVLTNCHAAFQRNPLAKRAVTITRHFAIGKGFNLTVQNEQVKAVLDAFIANDENNVAEYEKTFLQDLFVDGEIFIRFFQKDGETVIVPLPPWWIVDIETDKQFFRRVKSYKVQPGAERQSSALALTLPTPPYDVPANEILHVAINRHSYELRGRPDLFVTLPWLRAHKEFMEDRVRQNKWRGALLWWVKVASAVPGIIATLVARYRTPPTPGSTVVTSDKETWTPLTNPVGASDVSEDGRQIKMQVAVGVGLPEYMLSDGQNANLASATAQQLPALWLFTDAQEIMKEMVWTKIFKRVIEHAVSDDGLLSMVRLENQDGEPKLDDQGQEQMVPATEAFSVEYHELQSSDPKTVAEALTLDLNNNLVSKQTAMTKRGYDPDEEKKLMDREDEEQRDKVAQGLAMAPILPNLNNPNQASQQPPPPPGQNGQTQPAAPADR